MATPIYKGTGQPAAERRLAVGLGSWFGGSAPAYARHGPSRRGGRRAPGGATPAYKPAPTPIGSRVIPRALTRSQQRCDASAGADRRV